jgi:predicted DNA-binding transcriptional regulator AlpA
VKEIAMSNSQPILSEFLTTEELAAELGVNKRTLDRWAVLGTGPPRTRIGRKIFYRRASVQKWLAAQEQSSVRVTLSTRQAERPCHDDAGMIGAWHRSARRGIANKGLGGKEHRS